MAESNCYNAVHKPSHYTEGRKYEPKDVIRDWGLNFNVGSAVKYLSRAGRKDDIIQDLSKAKEFIQFEIEAIKEERRESVEDKDKVESYDLLEILGMSASEFVDKYYIKGSFNSIKGRMYRAGKCVYSLYAIEMECNRHGTVGIIKLHFIETALSAVPSNKDGRNKLTIKLED